MTDIFKAIADPTRRSILLQLSQQSSTVNEIARQFDMSRPAVSKHLHILNSNGLVRMENDAKDARQINCYAQLAALKDVHDYLENLRHFWEDNFNSLDKFLDHE